MPNRRFYRQPAQGYRPVLHAAGPHVGHHRARPGMDDLRGAHRRSPSLPSNWPRAIPPTTCAPTPSGCCCWPSCVRGADVVAGGVLLPLSERGLDAAGWAVGLPLHRSLPYRPHSAGKTTALLGLLAQPYCCQPAADGLRHSGVVIILLFRLTRGVAGVYLAQAVGLFVVNQYMLIGQVYLVGPFEINRILRPAVLPLIWLYNGQHGRKNKDPATRRLRVLPRTCWCLACCLWQSRKSTLHH